MISPPAHPLFFAAGSSLILGNVSTRSPRVLGIDLDEQTRCRHYHSPQDIIAIKMKCCGEYYACKECHAALAAHETKVWPRNEWLQLAVLCGSCRNELTITQYIHCSSNCPICDAEFNPGCRNHYHFYFEQ
jgi:uncharacterized CHY-type Zn-finger protein